MSMKLAVSNWFPYRHQATALQQLIGDPLFEIVSLDSVSNPLCDASFGPFVVMLQDGAAVTGVPSIVEALDRRFPGRGILGDDALSRAQVRAFAAMIEERFSRLCVAAISRHEQFGRPIWHAQSGAPDKILETPPPLATVEKQLAASSSRYVVGERPSLADCLLAALWWTAEDLGATHDLVEHKWISAWHARNCNGDPFKRVVLPRSEIGLPPSQRAGQ